MNFLIRLLINAAALWIAALVVPRFVFDGGLAELLLVTVLFGLVNAIIRPVVRLLTLPLTIVTFGLFGLVVNGAMLLLTIALSDAFEIEGRLGSQLFSAVAAALVVSVVSTVASRVLPDGRR